MCICPTRELVVQNLTVLRKMAKYTSISATSTASETEAGGGGIRRDPITEHVSAGTWGGERAGRRGCNGNASNRPIEAVMSSGATAEQLWRIIRSLFPGHVGLAGRMCGEWLGQGLGAACVDGGGIRGGWTLGKRDGLLRDLQDIAKNTRVRASPRGKALPGCVGSTVPSSSLLVTSTASQTRVAPPHPQVVIGTHGKLKNWVSKRLLDLDGVVILVFDEADEMLKVGAGGGGGVRR